MAFFKGDIFSSALVMDTQVNVIIPDNVDVNDANVLYLLHGYSDNASKWSRMTRVEKYANERGFIVVMPEVYHSYYTDMLLGQKYFTYINEELPKIMQRLFNVSDKREKNFVAGLSMGGYGALKSALKSPDNYLAGAGFSSACDISECINRKFSQKDRVDEFTAIFGMDYEVPPKDDIYALAKKASESSHNVNILMTCGTEDFLFVQNENVANYIKKLDINFKYVTKSGTHEWGFWDDSIQIAMDFFLECQKNI